MRNDSNAERAELLPLSTQRGGSSAQGLGDLSGKSSACSALKRLALKRLLTLVCLLLAGTAVLAGDDDRVAQVERDIASIDTHVRMMAAARAAKIEDVTSRRRLFIAFARDPAPEVRRFALDMADLWANGPDATAAVVSALVDRDHPTRAWGAHAALHLSEEDLRRIPLDELTSLLPAAAIEAKEAVLTRLLRLVRREIDGGVAVSISAMLANALEARSTRACDELLALALRATTVAQLSSDCVPPLTRLLEKETTRERTLDLIVRARGPVGWRLLLEVEATTTSDSERERAEAALEHHQGHANDFHQVLEDAAKNAKDERVRTLAKKRLEDW